MKTKEEILQGKYTIGDFVFYDGTPMNLAKKIIEIIKSDERIILDYGDIETGISWGERYDITGRIGYSKGYYGLKYPILVYSKKSLGGTDILTNRILSIKKSKGKNIIYEHISNSNAENKQDVNSCQTN